MSKKEIYDLLCEHIIVDKNDIKFKYFRQLFNYNVKRNNKKFIRANYAIWFHIEKITEENDRLLQENIQFKQENKKIKFAQPILLHILQENKKDYETNIVKLSNEKIILEKELEQSKMFLNLKINEYNEK